MKKQTAFLMLILLLALSGCRVQPVGDAETPAPTLSPTPTPSETAPAPTASASTIPVETEEIDEPVPTGTPDTDAEETVPPDESGDLDEEGRYETALAWCEEHKSEFSNAEFYAMDRGYWFADYAPGVTAVPFEAGNIWFYEDAAGTATPAEAAVALFQNAGACFESQEPEDRAAQKDRIARAAAAGAEGDAEAVERWLTDELTANPAYFVGLGEDMWLCGVAPQSDLSVGWFVMMKQGNVYRLQHDRAFGPYAQSPEAQVRIQFDKVLEAWNWFAASLMPIDPADKIETEQGVIFYRVDYPGITTALEMRTYLKTLFSDDIVDALLSAERYRDFDGVFYAASLDAGRPLVIQGRGQVLRESDTKLVYRVTGEMVPTDPGDSSPEPQAATLNFPYELVGNKWVFTEFSWGA